jgi:hydrogenase maturation factor
MPKRFIFGFMLVIILAACGTIQSQDSTTKTDVTAGTAIVATETVQSEDLSAGAKVNAERVDKVVTENNSGISPYWFIVGALVFGMIIPQPRIVRAIF